MNITYPNYPQFSDFSFKNIVKAVVSGGASLIAPKKVDTVATAIATGGLSNLKPAQTAAVLTGGLSNVIRAAGDAGRKSTTTTVQTATGVTTKEVSIGTPKSDSVTKAGTGGSEDTGASDKQKKQQQYIIIGVVAFIVIALLIFAFKK
ncbi:MAG: hypothetical protein PHX80_05405 [Candidatus Nanoarchaeia archaeon]|nr:hypothetical protein [Candidatus Nanoarchaeia archaeon]